MKRSVPFILAFILVACSKKDDVKDPLTNTPGNNPSSITAFTGDTITIAGKDLGTDIRTLAVKFGDVVSKVISVSDTSAKVVVPDDLETSAVKIHLFSLNNETSADFKLKAALIQSVSPDSGFAGQQITITGQGFSRSRKVSFGDKLLNATYQSNSSLTIQVPDSIQPGKYTIAVSVAELKTSAAKLFSVIPLLPPTFTRFSPETAFIGDTITLEGGYLSDASKVNFGNVEATVVSATATAVRVVVPDEIAEASVKIRLNSGGTELSSATDFRLKAPVIDSLSVTSGFAGQFLRIYGRGFRESTITSQIDFGPKTIAANTGSTEHSMLFMSVPKNLAAGKYAVKVTVAGMTATAADLFEVFVPTITSFTPHSASTYNEMIITGTNLKNINTGVTTSVSFEDFATGAGGRVALITSTSADQIKLRVPDGLEVGRTYRVVVNVVSSIVKTTEPFTLTE